MSVRSAGVVIYRRGRGGERFLLLQYPGGHWDFAKGHVEEGETEQEAALREAEEETGMRLRGLDEGFEERIRYSYYHAGRRVRKTVVFFMAEARTGRVRLSEEHVEYEWLTYEEARGRATFANARRVLAGAMGRVAGAVPGRGDHRGRKAPGRKRGSRGGAGRGGGGGAGPGRGDQQRRKAAGSGRRGGGAGGSRRGDDHRRKAAGSGRRGDGAGGSRRGDDHRRKAAGS
ncbi:MAG: NUDIX domain-containing protein, partial [Nitrosopumilus sp.]|nr:NUDIX domain-containing protein [Nitrosopumilus sp.]